MSQQNCTEFFTKISADATLQQEFLKIIKGKGDITQAATNLVQMGTKHGYKFTEQEAIQKYQEIIATAQGELYPTSETELDDQALELVAGGSTLALLIASGVLGVGVRAKTGGSDIA